MQKAPQKFFVKIDLRGNKVLIDESLSENLKGYIYRTTSITDFTNLIFESESRKRFYRAIEEIRHRERYITLSLKLAYPLNGATNYNLELGRIDNEVIGFFECKLSHENKEISKGESSNHSFDSLSFIEGFIRELNIPSLILNYSANIVYANNSTRLILFEKPEDIIGESIFNFIDNRDREKLKKSIAQIISNKEHKIFNIEVRLAVSELRYAEFSLLPISNSKETSILLLIMRDITKRRLGEKYIKKLLVEKSAILKEMHHRIKNNFQFLLSILNLQKSSIINAETLKALNSISYRIKSMAYIHEQLYEVYFNKKVEIRTFINNLIKNIYIEIGAHEKIRITTFLDDIEMSVERAFYLGLILNELVTNSVLHSINKVKNQVLIEISLKRLNGSKNILIVSDNGVGLPDYIDINQPKTLGFKLVSIFSRQLNGKIFRKNNKGTKIEIIFPNK